MKNWLGNYVTEELKLAIQWKRRTFVKKHIKAEPVDDYNFFKHEPLENPDLSVPPVTPRTYEDDGSNLRAKLSRTVDVQSVLQITGVCMHIYLGYLRLISTPSLLITKIRSRQSFQTLIRA